jgi:hypothetical protein
MSLFLELVTAETVTLPTCASELGFGIIVPDTFIMFVFLFGEI